MRKIKKSKPRGLDPPTTDLLFHNLSVTFSLYAINNNLSTENTKIFETIKKEV